MAKQSKVPIESGLVRLCLWHSFFYFLIFLNANKSTIESIFSSHRRRMLFASLNCVLVEISRQ